jgi:hypothetical protein
MREPNQKLRFNTHELGLLKSLLADNEELLFAIRKVMIQAELTTGEQAVLDGAINDETFKLIKKFMLPEVDGDSPLFQLAHLGIGLGSEVKNLSPDGAWPFIKAKELEIKYVAQQLEVLRGRTPETNIRISSLMDLSGSKPTRETVYTNVLAWNFLITFIDSTINQMKILAGYKTETPDETLQRLAKDSAK